MVSQNSSVSLASSCIKTHYRYLQSLFQKMIRRGTIFNLKVEENFCKLSIKKNYLLNLVIQISFSWKFTINSTTDIYEIKSVEVLYLVLIVFIDL